MLCAGVGCESPLPQDVKPRHVSRPFRLAVAKLTVNAGPGSEHAGLLGGRPEIGVESVAAARLDGRRRRLRFTPVGRQALHVIGHRR